MSLKKQAISGIFWTFLQQFSNRIITFLVSIILARLLLPEEFGLIAMISVFYSIARILIESGLTQSIIRSEDVDEEEYSTVFYFNFFVSIIVYFLLFQSAPLVSSFYNQNQLTNIIRAYGVILVINSLSSIQFTKLSKSMNFKTQIIVAVPSMIIGSLVGIYLAYHKFGVWSLVYAEIVKASLTTLQVFWYSKWVPLLKFNYFKLKKHLKFGLNMMFSYLLDVVYKNIYVIFIGKFYSSEQLGYYSRADLLKQLPVANLVFALNKVTLPLFSSINNDAEKLKRAYQKIMSLITFVIAPLLVFMVVLAEPIIVLLFTEKWLPSVPYFQLLAFVGILQPIQSYNMNILLVKGESKLYLILEVSKKIIITISVLFTYQYGINTLIIFQIILSVLFFFMNSYFAGRLINYSTYYQIKDLFPIVFMAFISGVILYYFDIYILNEYFNDFFRISSGMLLGFSIFLVPFIIFKHDNILEISKILRISKFKKLNE